MVDTLQHRGGPPHRARRAGTRGARATAGGVPAMLRRLGAVQLDTISVLARSHELVAYARQGAIGRARVERAYWGPKSATFEYWSHAACVVPLEDWPAYAFKRQRPAGQGEALARAGGARQELQRGAGPPARRGPADGQRAGRRQEGRAVVGLVRDQDRRRVAARHRRARLPRAARLPACLRPGRACHPGRAAGAGVDRRGVRPPSRCGGRALPRRGDRGRPGRATTGCRARSSAGCCRRPA